MQSRHETLRLNLFISDLVCRRQDLIFAAGFKECAVVVPRKRKSLDERDAVVERLRQFLRFGYMTASQVAQRIGVHDGTVYSWLLGEFRPTNPKRLIAFLDSLPAERASGVAPIGYEYRPYPTAPKRPRPCPFCRKARGEIRKVRGGFQGVCPDCGSTGPKRESRDEALGAWNGKG